jgi:hypothetical protein
MKNRRRRLGWVAGALLILSVTLAFSFLADFNLPWFSINSGGAVLVSDKFILNGSAGQALVGGLEGEFFRVASGFWGDFSPLSTGTGRIIFLPMTVR